LLKEGGMGFASYFLFFITTIIITCIRGRAGDWCLSIRRGKQGVMASFQGLLLPPFCPSTVKEYTFDKLRAQLLTYASTLLHTEEWLDLSISVPTATTSIPVDPVVFLVQIAAAAPYVRALPFEKLQSNSKRGSILDIKL
jgi:hypothetical protein